VSSLEHIKRPLLGAWDTFARFLSMFQLLDTVLFCTWLGYSVAMPRKLVWIEKQNFQGFGCSECNWKFRAIRQHQMHPSSPLRSVTDTQSGALPSYAVARQHHACSEHGFPTTTCDKSFHEKAG
jgi:hypothetical protein